MFEGETYWGYSQAVPGDISDLSQVRFAIFFMLPKKSTQSFNIELEGAIKLANKFFVVIIFTLLSMVMMTVYLIIFLYARKITAPISKLTDYTSKMKQAQDREAKLYIVS